MNAAAAPILTSRGHRACVVSWRRQRLRVAGRGLATLVEQRRARVGFKGLTRRRVLGQIVGPIVIFRKGTAALQPVVESVLGRHGGSVPRPVLPFEAAAFRAVLPADAPVGVVAFTVILPGDFTRAVERRVNRDRASEVRLRVSIAVLRWIPREGAYIVPSWVGEGR